MDARLSLTSNKPLNRVFIFYRGKLVKVRELNFINAGYSNFQRLFS